MQQPVLDDRPAGALGSPPTPPIRNASASAVAASLPAVFALTACGGGGEGTASSAPSPAANPLTASPLLTADMAASRFLQHAGVGATDADIAAVKAVGAPAWLEAQMTLPRGERAWDWSIAKGYGDIDQRFLFDSGGPTVDFALAYQMASAPDTVRKRAALALSEYFVVSALVAQVNWTGLAMAHYWDELNDHAFGNFRDLLQAMTLNPALAGAGTLTLDVCI